MPVVLYRVDDRLIHGQVVEGWIPELKITEVDIISEKIKNDTFTQNIMRFSTPTDVKLKFFDIESASEYLIKEAPYSKENILVLFPSLFYAAELIKREVKINFINVGGIHYSVGKNFSLGKAIFLSEEDCQYLKFLNSKGVKIEGKGVPNDKAIDILASIE